MWKVVKKAYHKQRKALFVRFPNLYSLIDKNKIIIKYIISGGTAAFVDLFLLFIFTDVIGLHYLVSAVLAFMMAIFVSFNLQKYWTFRDANKNIAGQLAVYIFTGIMNLGLNTMLMYIFVDYFDLMYLVAQIFAGGLVAFGSFMIYRFIIFKKNEIKTA